MSPVVEQQSDAVCIQQGRSAFDLEVQRLVVQLPQVVADGDGFGLVLGVNPNALEQRFHERGAWAQAAWAHAEAMWPPSRRAAISRSCKCGWPLRPAAWSLAAPARMSPA